MINEDAAQRFMVAYVRGLRDYNDAFAKNMAGLVDGEMVYGNYDVIE